MLLVGRLCVGLSLTTRYILTSRQFRSANCPTIPTIPSDVRLGERSEWLAKTAPLGRGGPEASPEAKNVLFGFPRLSDWHENRVNRKGCFTGETFLFHRDKWGMSVVVWQVALLESLTMNMGK